MTTSTKMIKKSILFLILCLSINSIAQISISPATAGPDDEITLTYDASLGNKELINESKIYIHHGIVTDKPDGTSWQKVKGNWGKDDGIGLMTKVDGSNTKWEIKFKPTLRKYFDLSPTDNIFRIACVFRSADGNNKGSINPGNYSWGTVIPNLDNYVTIYGGDYLVFDSPVAEESYLSVNQNLSINISASNNVTDFKLFLDEGNGYNEKVSTATGKAFQYSYKVDKSVALKIKAQATINGKSYTVEKIHNIVLQKSSVVAPLPSNLKLGINYISETSATLVLEAPNKKFVYVVGDFSSWMTEEKNQMNVTPDGQIYWLELKDLQPKKEYVFQYWIDGNLKIADPYADKIADPWNDSYIESTVYPNLPVYDKTNFGIASVLQTAQTPYQWSTSENTYKRPNANHLVIYELHLRDFIKDHDMKTLVDTIQYLKRLGINAIEFMPLGEFEGNDSWGYNPSFHMAVDKYYGSKDDLKKLIEVCHQNGIAAILDIVLNHAYGQNPLVQMYFEGGKPAANNPWFNRDGVGPYQWGYDFNHESEYTKRYIDRVNEYWLKEFHFDGFRFDFTKGFTNFAPSGNIDGFDQSRINIIKRMADKIREVDSKAIIILEHWAGAQEESILGEYGLKMWRNKSYDYVPATIGEPRGNFNGMIDKTHVSFFNSHDERRIAEHVITEGKSLGSYNTKQLEIMYERVKLAAAFTYLFPGPKMIWQFDELGYDIDINLNGRVGRKPLPWGQNSLNYYENDLRQNIYKTYQELLKLRNLITPELLEIASTNHQLSGDVRRLVFNTQTIDIVLIGNFGLNASTISPEFPSTGNWYNYFSGEEKMVVNANQPINLDAGEWQLFTSEKISNGIQGVVENYKNPVTITPVNFTQDDEITLTFDAKLATKAGTKGLIGAEKVYFHSGVIKNYQSGDITNVVGNLSDDGIGQMTKLGNDLWQIKFVPAKYYKINDNEDIYNISMYFRDATNQNLGKGFRNKDIVFGVASNDPFVTISPSKFDLDTEITITFNAVQGNRELAGSNSIYMHSGAGLQADNPESNAWAKVVGNWGKDDGVGKMTKLPNSNLYQIKLKPRSYYNLKDSDFPFWIAAVFRSPDGSKKGTGNPGPIPNGFIAANQDFFFKNQPPDSIDVEPSEFGIFPNPTNGPLNIKGFKGEALLSIFSMDGKLLFKKNIVEGSLVLPSNIVGSVTYTLQHDGFCQSGVLVVVK